MIGHLLNNGIQVKKALHSFYAGDREFPGGTYIIPMHQGLRGLVNTMLWSGEDLSLTVKAMYDVSVFPFPRWLDSMYIPYGRIYRKLGRSPNCSPVKRGTFGKE
jgi:hypothetical protein